MTTITGKVTKKRTIMQTIEVEHLIKDFYTVEDNKIDKMAHVQRRRCFMCGCKFEIGDKVSVAFTAKGNKCLCENCVEKIDE